MSRVIFFFLIISVGLCGCNTALKNTVEQQQQIIDDMNATIEKMDAKLQALEQTTKTLQQEMSTIKENLKKTSPAYFEGSVQEGS